MRQEFLTFGEPDLQEPEIEEVVSTLRSGWIGTGPRVAQFERSFAAYKKIESSHVAAVSSATAALHLSLIAAGVGPGDEVITTAVTFCATVNAIIHSGATPVLADVNPETMNIDALDVARKVTKRTRAILPVHFAGNPCDMGSLQILADEHGLVIIEDCAHAIEAQYQGRSVGALGDFGCFSFYVTKNVTCGEGGMVVAREERNIERIKRLALHGLSKDAWQRYSDQGFKHYTVTECGFKYNMMDLQAAIGIHQLARIEANWRHRQSVWNTYQEKLSRLPVRRPVEAEPDCRHGYHLYTVLIDPQTCGRSRDDVLELLYELKIGAGVHYLSVAEHPYYRQRYGWNPDAWPHAKKIGRQTLSLPLSAKLTDRDQEDVISSLAEILNSTI